jgi:hypothetical protein
MEWPRVKVWRYRKAAWEGDCIEPTTAFAHFASYRYKSDFKLRNKRYSRVIHGVKRLWGQRLEWMSGETMIIFQCFPLCNWAGCTRLEDTGRQEVATVLVYVTSEFNGLPWCHGTRIRPYGMAWWWDCSLAYGQARGFLSTSYMQTWCYTPHSVVSHTELQ